MHFYSWEKGLKTGIYYLRRRARHQAQQFTIEPEKAKSNGVEEDEVCEMCSHKKYKYTTLIMTNTISLSNA